MLRYLILPLALFVCASAVNDPESGQPPEKKARTCYFASQKTSPRENGTRPANSRTTTTCHGGFTELSRLALNAHGDWEGAPHELALILSRYEGIFLNESSDVTEWDGSYICDHHLAELSREWGRVHRNHVIWLNGKKLCGHFDHAIHPAYSEATYSLTYEQSDRILEENQRLMQAGLPLCKRHHDALTAKPTLPILEVKDEPSPRDAEAVCYADDKQSVKKLTDKSFTHTERSAKYESPLQHYFKQFAKEAGATRFRCRKSFHELSYKGQWSKARVALLLEKVAVEQLAGESEQAQSDLSSLIRRLRDGKPTSSEDHETLVSVLDGVAEEFRIARTTKEKVMIISLFARQIPYRVLSKYVDGLSERLFYEAKKKALDAKSYKEPSHTKERFNRVKLSHFISFITSGHIMVGLPWGEKRTKDSKGNVVYLPNYIRTTGIHETIDLYEEYMRQTGRADLLLSRSTTYRILKTLPAMKTTSMTCVDYFAASATNAFISIERMLEEFDALSLVDTTDVKYLKKSFEEIKHYLKGNYRLHLKTESVYSDTCLLWSLSDPKDTRLSAPTAKHTHKNRCPECKKMDETINGVQKLLDQLAKDVKEAELHKKIKEFQHEFGLNVERIYDLKAHHVRTIMASKERDRLIAGLQDNQVGTSVIFSRRSEGSKRKIKDYIGKRHDVNTVEDMYTAILDGKQLRGVSVHLGTVTLEKLSPSKIEKISELGAFSFAGDKMRAWRFQGVGEGIEFSNLHHVQAKFDPKSGGKVASEKVKDSDLVKISKGEEPFFWYLPAAKKDDEVPEVNDVDDDVASDRVSQNPVAAQTPAVFYCKTCGASFLKYRNLAAHVDCEKCKKRPETVSLLDYALGLFKDQLEEVQQAIALLPLSDSIQALQTGTDKELPKGWALRMTRKGGRYPEKSKLFVKNKFEEAMSQKKKIRGEEVELLMKADATIAPEERMSLDQIRNFIRTLAAPIKPKRTRGSRSVPVYTDEDGFVEEEVDVPEEEHQYTDDDLYIHVNDHADEYFTETGNPDVSTDNDDGECGCKPLPMIDASWGIPNGVEAQVNAPGACTDPSQDATFWGGKFAADDYPMTISSTTAAEFQGTCQAGIWLFTAFDYSDDWEATNVTCRSLSAETAS